VITNAAGIVSLDALRWCQSLGVGVLILGSDGIAQLASTPRMTDDAGLRRTQALAPERPYGLDIARWLLGHKVAARASLVASRFDDHDTTETIAELAGEIELAESIEEARQLEASAAALYFGAWSARPETSPRFAAQDRRRIAPHWSTLRRSALDARLLEHQPQGREAGERPPQLLLRPPRS
jgi:CRISPR/Cas system-associated endonuclease Cas1